MAVELHIVSDSTGETAARLVQALEAQFPEQEFEEVRHPRVESVADLELAVRTARGRPADRPDPPRRDPPRAATPPWRAQSPLRGVDGDLRGARRGDGDPAAARLSRHRHLRS